VCSLTLAAACAVARAADTGMLYVRSDPSGATVLVDGVERGKTPVLIRDLPAGMHSIELTLEGAQPKKESVKVEAGAVGKFDAELKAPEASLTIITQPLEALVVLDRVSRGATPLTLQGLGVGEHRLLIRKQGFEDHASTVVLAAGESRTLEIALTTTTSRDATVATSPAREAVPSRELGEALDEFLESVANREYARASISALRRAKSPEFAGVAGQLRAAADVAAALQRRHTIMVETLEKQHGKLIELDTTSGRREGRLMDVASGGILLGIEIRVGGRVMGRSKLTVKWEDLTSAEEARLSPGWPEDAHGHVALALLALGREDADGALEALSKAAGHPLSDECRTRAEALRKPAAPAGATRKRARLPKVTRGLIGWWTFDEGKDALVLDRSGNGHHGTRVPSPPPGASPGAWVPGRFGKAANFDGTDEWIRVSHAPALNAYPITLCAWVRARGRRGTAGIVGKYYRGSFQGYQLLTIDGRIRAWYCRDRRNSIVPQRTGLNGGDIADGAWHHVAFAVDNQRGVLYVDGVLRDEARWDGSPGPTRATNDLCIGRFEGEKPAIGGFLAGAIDDVRIYNRALAAREVVALARQPDEARDAYDAAMAEARRLVSARRWDEAMEALQRALEARPDDEDAKSLVATVRRHVGSAPGLVLELGPGVTMELVLVNPGVFTMGGAKDPRMNLEGVEKPKHDVAITRPYCLGKYEVTRQQFAAFVNATGYKTEAEREGGAWEQQPGGSWQDTSGASWRGPKYFEQDDTHPATAVSWNDARAFCDWATRTTRRPVRLPTEAEWEYACRARSTGAWCCGDADHLLGDFAWYGANAARRTHPVGGKKPNAWGLFDMHGNVWEWVADRYGADYYSSSSTRDPAGPRTGDSRVLRGGSYGADSRLCRSASRRHGLPSNRTVGYGFRVAVSPRARR